MKIERHLKLGCTMDSSEQGKIAQLEEQLRLLQNQLLEERFQRQQVADKLTSITAARPVEIESSSRRQIARDDRVNARSPAAGARSRTPPSTSTRGEMSDGRFHTPVSTGRNVAPRRETPNATTTPSTSDLSVAKGRSTPTRRPLWASSPTRVPHNAGNDDPKEVSKPIRVASPSPGPHKNRQQQTATRRMEFRPPPPKSPLELAWHRFAVMAQHVLKEDELPLVSAETLGKLLDVFGVTDEFERAQIEAQWSIYQHDAEELASNGTGRYFGIHDQPFDLRMTPGKAHMSHRRPLSRGRGSANPNDAGAAEYATPRKSTGKHIAHHDAVPVTSNPNAVQTPDAASHRRPSIRVVDGSPTAESRYLAERKQSIAIVPGPDDGRERVERGIKSSGSTHCDPNRPPAVGISTSARPRDSFVLRSELHDDVPRQSSGLRTYSMSLSSPDRAFPSSPRTVLRRDSLVTESAARYEKRSHVDGESFGKRINSVSSLSASTSLRQLRTPFAVDGD